MRRMSLIMYFLLGFSLISSTVLAKEVNTAKSKTHKAKKRTKTKKANKAKKAKKAKKNDKRAAKRKVKTRAQRGMIRFKDLTPKMQKRLKPKLRAQGIKVTGSTALGSIKDNCPSNCNDSAGGGFCFCDPDSKGNCPSGTDDYPMGGGKKKCRAEMDSVSVSDGKGAEQKLSF